MASKNTSEKRNISCSFKSVNMMIHLYKLECIRSQILRRSILNVYAYKQSESIQQSYSHLPLLKDITKSYSTQSHSDKPTRETIIVQNCGQQWMKWIGVGSTMQMYCSFLYSGALVYNSMHDPTFYEMIALGGVISSSSACIFFGAKMIFDKVITDITSYRLLGDKKEYVKITLLSNPVLRPLEFSVEPREIKVVEKKNLNAYVLRIGTRTLSLDLTNGEILNRTALDILLSGRPIVQIQGQNKKLNKKRR